MPRRRISDYLGESSGRSTEPAVDVDIIIKKTVEAAVAELARGLIREIRQLRESVDEMKAKIEALEKGIEECKSRSSPQARRRGRGNLADRLAEILGEEGYILASTAKARMGLNPYRLRDLAEEIGAKIIDLGHDFAVVDPQAYREYMLLLATNRKRDPQEAAKAMGRYKELFEKMREAAIIYYDAKRGAWSMVE